MSIYSFGNNSPINEVLFRRTKGGGIRAYLFAREDADPDKLNALKEGLVTQDLQWTPIKEEGKPALEVRGFGKENELLRFLSKREAVIGGYTKKSTPDDTVTWKDKIDKNRLRVSGIGYFIGDMSYLSYGLKEARNMAGEWINLPALFAGIFYALGSPFMTFFGQGDKSDFQLKRLSYNMIHDLKNQHIDVPMGAALHATASGHNDTLGKKIRNFCMHYPAEMTNAIFGMAGSMIIWEKIKNLHTFDWGPLKQIGKVPWRDSWAFLKSKERIAGQTPHSRYSVLLDIGLGTMTLLAGLVSVFVEEEVPKPDEPKKKGFARLWQWVKEKPLRTAAGLLAVSSLVHAGSTAVDWRYVRNHVPNPADPIEVWEFNNLRSALGRRAIFVGSNLGAEAMMAMSSKGHGAGVISDLSLDTSAYALAADLIQRSAPEKREELLDRIANYYARKEHLGSTAAIHKEGIRKQLEAMEHNPWASSPSPKSKQEAQEPTQETGLWQNKMAAAQIAIPAIQAPAL